MGVFDQESGDSHLGTVEGRPYTCMACEAALEVQYHSCPDCGGYDVRRAEWVGD